MDGSINEIITITIDDPRWADRTKKSALLIIHTIFRPLQSSKPLKLDEPISLRKLSGEGQFYERKTCMGWETQTRSLWVLLPGEKETAWVQEIRATLTSTKKGRQYGIPHRQAQSCRTNHPPHPN